MPIHLLTNGVRFNSDHYGKVTRAREERGLPIAQSIMGEEGNRYFGHPMEGERVIGKKGVAYIIETVHLHWYFGGWYFHAVARREGTRSHTTFVMDNLNSKLEMIQEFISEFKVKFKPDRVKFGSIVHKGLNGRAACGMPVRKVKAAGFHEPVNCHRCKRL